jgi:hypothetical protein
MSRLPLPAFDLALGPVHSFIGLNRVGDCRRSAHSGDHSMQPTGSLERVTKISTFRALRSDDGEISYGTSITFIVPVTAGARRQRESEREIASGPSKAIAVPSEMYRA